MKKREIEGTKLLWHMDRVMAYFDRGKRVPPIHIDMGIAKFCNLRCIFCYGVYQNFEKKFIRREALLQTLKDAAEIGVKSIAIIGDGEPTMNPHFYEALYVGKKAGLDLATSTNGVLLNTDKKLEAILENCEWMRFCFSAGTKEGYKKIHGVDAYDRVVKNIERMVYLKEKNNYKCDIGLQAVFIPNLMEQEMIEEAKLAVDLGVDYFLIKQCSLPEGNTKVGDVTFDVNDYDKPEVIEALKKAESYSNKKTDIIVKWNLMKQKGRRPYDGCLSVPFISEISGNGDWYPCGYMFGDKPQFKKYRFGNVHEKRLRDIFYSPRYWKIIEMMKNFDVHNDCYGACRLDKTNEFCYNYVNKPKGINFI